MPARKRAFPRRGWKSRGMAVVAMAGGYGVNLDIPLPPGYAVLRRSRPALRPIGRDGRGDVEDCELSGEGRGGESNVLSVCDRGAAAGGADARAGPAIARAA